MDLFRKQPVVDDTLSKRITYLEQLVSVLQTRIDGIELVNTDLRNKVLRKIQKLPDEAVQQPVLKAGQRVK